jgi:hypothetical protein
VEAVPSFERIFPGRKNGQQSQRELLCLAALITDRVCFQLALGKLEQLSHRVVLDVVPKHVSPAQGLTATNQQVHSTADEITA